MSKPLQKPFVSSAVLTPAILRTVLTVLLSGVFGVCFAQPANDNPCNATTLTVGATCNYTSFDNTGATATTGAPAPGCGNFQNGDIWFTVTVPAGGAINFDTQIGTLTDGAMAVYSGTCNALTLVACDDNSSPNGSMPAIGLTGQTPGTVLYVRFWGRAQGQNASFGAFGICVSTPPGNDNPCTATPLTISATGCTYVQGSNLNSTNTTGVPAPGCGSYNGQDVWFSATVPSSGSIVLQTQSGTMTDGAMAVYSGPCSALSLVQCNDDFTGLMPGMTVSNLTPGSTVYIRMWSFNNTNNGTFQLCGRQNTPLSPTNQDCPNAIPICQNVYSNPLSYVGTGNVLNEINPAISCLNSGERNDVWYTFTVQQSGNLNFTITPVNMSDDYDWAVYNLTNASCANIASNGALQISCNYSATPGNTGPTGGSNSNSQGALGTPYNQVIPVTAGQTYVVNVSNYSATADGYSINFGASSAVIFDNVPPQMTGLTSTTTCGSSQLTFTFSENILCNTIQNSDFTLTGPGGPYTITGWSSSGCASGGTYGRTVTVTISPAIRTSGSFSLCLVNASASVTDLCGNVAPPACFNFTIAPITLTTSSTPPACAGGSTGSMTVSPTTGVSPYTYAWSPNVGTSSTISNAAAGTYNVTVTDANGCTATTSVTLTNPPPITANLTANSPPCSNQTGSATVTASGGTPGLSYSWSPSGGSGATASGLAAGTYTVTVTDSRGCTATATASITAPTPFTATIPTVNPPRCSNTANGSLTASATAGAPTPITYSWSPSGGNGATASNLAAGTYTVTVTNGSGCTATATTTIAAPPPITPTINNNIPVSCNGTATGSLSVTATGGTSPYSYSWSPSGGSSSTANNLAVGSYTVTLTDANGCTATVSATVTQPPPVAGTMTAVAVTCNGLSNGSATVTASGGTAPYTYSWVPTGGSGTTATGLAAGTYTVTITDARGCTTTRTVPVTAPTPITATTTSTTATCGLSDGTAQISVNGGTTPYTYSWSPSGGNGTSATGLAGGAYSVLVTDGSGCTYQATVTVGNTTPAVATITNSTNVPLAGGNTGSATVAVTGNSGAPQYSWSPSGGTGATATGLSAGTYSVTVTDGSGCNTVATVTITAPPPLTLAIPTVTQVLCAGGATGSATALAGGGSPGYTYSWSNGGGNSVTANNLAAGSYSVTITDAQGCTLSATTAITAPPPVTANITPVNVTCNGLGNGSASVSPGGGTPAYTFSWSPSGGSGATASGLSPNSYTVTVTDAHGCTNSATTTISQPPPLVASITPTPIPCAGSTSGSVSVTISGGTAPLNYSWTPNSGNSATISNLAAGTYSVTVTDASGCTVTASTAVTQPQPLVLTAATLNQVLCAGGATGSASASASGGTAGYTYNWSPGGGSNATASNLAAGNYTVTVTDAAGCTQTAVTAITQPPPLNTTATVTGTIACAGGTTGAVSATAGGGTQPYSYSWGTSGSGSSLSGLPAGTYTVTATDGSGCTATSTTIITAPPALTLSMTPTNASCGLANGSISAIAGGGTGLYTYAWSPGGGNQFNATGLTTGSYTVTVTDANGCTRTASASITNTPPFIATTNVVSNVLCNGAPTGSAQVVVSQASNPVTYTWSPSGGSGATASNLAAGNYLVTATDAAGCTYSSFVVISEPTPIQASTAVTPVNCNGGNNGSASVSASGGTPGFTYSWSPTGGNGSSATGLTSGNYTVTVTDASGCTRTATANIVQPPLLTAVITPQAVSCPGGSNGSATAVPAGGTTGYTYSWTPTGGTSSSATGLASGTYTVTVTDGNGCTTNTSTNIAQPSPILSTVNTTPALCGNNNGTATLSGISGGTGPYTYSWSPGNATGTSPTGLAAGAYTVTITDSRGCTATNVATISNTGGPVATASVTGNVTCFGGNNGSAQVSASSSAQPLSYNWSPSGGASNSATGLAAGAYTVTVTDGNNCITTVNVNITAPPAIVTSAIVNSNILCYGGSTGAASATATGGTPGFTYVWNPGGITGASANGLTAGSYTVTTTDGSGCTNAATVNITQPPVLNASATSTAVSCNGGSNGTATVNANGGNGALSYSWSPSGGNGVTATGLSNGNYTVTVTDANGCTTLTTATVSQPAPVQLSTSTQPAVCGNNNGSASASSSGGTGTITYSWSTGSSSTGISNLGSGSYTVTATDANGCTATATAAVSSIGGPTIQSAVLSNVSCFGGNNGSASVTIQTGSVAPYTYSWSPSGGNGNTASNLPAGTYTVSVLDANGCLSASTVTVSEPTALNLQATGSSVLCFGQANGTASVTAAGGTTPYTYSWSGGAGTGTSPSNLQAGTYTVTVTDGAGCSTSSNATVTQPAQLTLSSTATQVSCYGGTNGTVSASVTGGTAAYSYSWSPSIATGAQATAVGAGTYTVTVTDANGCTSASTSTVSQPAPINLTFTTVPASCGSANGTATVSVSGGQAPFTYSWSPGGATGQTAGGLAAGGYSVTVTDQNGCSTVSSVAVSNAGTATVTSNVLSNVTCFGGNNGSASVSVIGGTPPFSYNWSPSGGTNFSAQNLIAGNYTVLVTDGLGCITTNQITITEPTQLTATATPSPISCFGGNNGSVTVNVSGGTNGYSYSWSPVGGTSATASGLLSGNYSVTVTDQQGCTTSTSASVQQPGQIVISPSSLPVTCNGGSDGSINLSISGGTSGYSVVWSPAVGNGQQLSGLASGSYTATVTDGNGCVNTQTIGVNQPAALQLTTTTIDATCGTANGSAAVLVTGGGTSYSYAWSPGGAVGSNVSNLAAGNYTVTVTDNAGCTTNATVAIANAGAPTLSVLSSTPASCNGGSDGTATISAAGGSPPFTYAWSPSGGTGTAASGLSAGAYQVSVTDSIGCISYVSVNIQEPAPIQLQSTAAAANCTAANGSASISAIGGNGGYTYSWSPTGGAGSTASGIPSGAYTVLVTDQSGCTQSGTVTVPNAGGGTATCQNVSTVSCNGGSDGSLSVSIAGGTAPYQYSWQPGGGSSATVAGLAAGTYSVTVTDANGCIATAQSVVTEPTSLNALTSTTPAACNGGTNGTATVTVAGGTSPYTYSWSPSGGSASLANGLAQGVYGVVITDANGCTLTASAVVNNTANIAVALSTTDVSCAGGSNGTASFSASGGTPPYSYAWSPNGSTGTAVNGLAAGNYQVTITDMMGCSYTELLSINEPSPINLTVSGSDTLCLSQTTVVNAAVAGGTAPYTYTWSNGSTSAAQTVSPTSSTSYSVIVTDANGCTSTSPQIPVGVYPPLQASATGSDTLCPGNPFTVSTSASGGDGNYSYVWSNSTFTGTGFTVTPQQDSLLSLTVTDGCGQSVTNQVLLVVSAGPQVNFTPYMVIDCAPVTVHFNNLTSAPAGSFYAWDFGDQQSSSLTEPVHTYDQPGIYSVSLSVTSQNGCEDSYTIPGLVEVSAGPSAGFTQSATEVTSVDALIGFTNGSTGAVAYNWSFGDGSASTSLHPTHQYNDTGLYQVQLVVTNEVGCLDTITGYVHVTEGFNIHIPNAFTPNGDQVNDFFLTFGYGFDDYDMYIIDRWGLMLFHSTDPEIGWDGTVGGYGETPCQNDVYEFIVIVRDFKGERHRYVGHVTLVR